VAHSPFCTTVTQEASSKIKPENQKTDEYRIGINQTERALFWKETKTGTHALKNISQRYSTISTT